MGLSRVMILHKVFILIHMVSATASVNDDDKLYGNTGSQRKFKSVAFPDTGKIPDAIMNDLQEMSSGAIDLNGDVQRTDVKPEICKEYLRLLVSIPKAYRKCKGESNCSCRNKSVYGQIVDCSSKKLNEIPTKIPSETSILLLNGNQIENVTNEAFQNLSKLKYLDVSYNRIKELSNSSFHGLEDLCILKLNGNRLRYTKETIPNDSFASLGNLIYLDLQQNLPNISIKETYPSVAIRALIYLQFLHIDGLGETQFQEDFKSLRMLSNLSMVGKSNYGRCEINTIRKNKFSSFPLLKSLTVVNCNVTKVENESFSELPSLNSLDLSYNEQLTFASLANITFALRDRPMYLLNATKIHTTFGECVRLDKDNMQYMKNMTIENLILDSNRLSVLTKDAALSVPTLTGMLSVRDNLLLLGRYIRPLIFHNNLTQMISFNMADQMVNHDLADLFLSFQQTVNAYHHFTKGKDKTILNHTENRRIVKRWFPWECKSCKDIPHALNIPIPHSIQNLDMSNIKSSYSLGSVCFCEPNSIKKLDLHRNVLSRIQGHVYGISKLEWLDFSSNFCENISAHVLHNLQGLQFLNLSNNYLGPSFKKDTDGNIFRYQTNLKTLDLTDNRITDLSSDFFSGLVKMENLTLKLNLMTEFKVDLKHAKRLKYLDLSNNILLHISDSAIQEFERLAVNNLTMDLSRNNLSCNCKHLNILKWMSETTIRFVNFKKYTCKDEISHLRNMSKAFELYAELSEFCRSYTLLIFISSVVFVLLLSIGFACILYRYRWNLRYIYYSGKMRMKGFIPIKDDDNDFDHDIFVSYANENLSFVTDFAIPELEEKRHLRLLLHDRDFRPGEFVHDNIVKAICTSNKTLIVMSEAFLRSIWCRFEMHMANMEAIKTGRNVLTLVLLEDVPTTGLPLEIVDIIRKKTYLEFPHEDEHREQFWDRLFEVLK